MIRYVPSLLRILPKFVTCIVLLATGYVSYNGYSDNAERAVSKAKVRAIYVRMRNVASQIGISPRFFIKNSRNRDALADPMRGQTDTITCSFGDWNDKYSNCSEGIPDFQALGIGYMTESGVSVFAVDTPSVKKPFYLKVSIQDGKGEETACESGRFSRNPESLGNVQN